MPRIRTAAEICAEIDSGEYCQTDTQLEFDALALIKANIGSGAVDLSQIEADLLEIIVQVQNLNLNTDEVESLLNQLIVEINTGAHATAVLDALDIIVNTLAELEIDTTAIENHLISLQSTLISEFDETQVLLANILSRLNADCSAPINVNVCNQVDLSVVESQLSSILSAIQALEVNTLAIESLLVDLIAELQAGTVALGDILTELSSILSAVQSIEVDTTAIEAAIVSLQSTVTSEGNQTQALLQAILDRLNTDCTAPLAVEVCNTEDLEVDLGGVISQLTQIKNHLSDLVSNTDNLETQIDTLIAEIQSGNLTVDAILTAVQDILVFAQAIAENTDELEQCCLDTQVLLQSEFDQTQSQLSSLDVKLQAIIDKPCCPTVLREPLCFDAGAGTQKGYEIAVYNPDGTLASRYATDRNHTTTHTSYAVVDCDPPEVIVIPETRPLARNDTFPSFDAGSPSPVNVASNDSACPEPQTTTWTLISGSESNCTVTGGTNGIFDVTPLAGGPWSFEYEIACDGTLSGATATASGSASQPTLPPGENFTVRSFGSHFDNLADVERLFDGDLNTRERLHQDALLELDFTVPYTGTETVGMYWSPEQQPNDAQYMGLEFLFSSDGGTTISHIEATPFEPTSSLTGTVADSRWFYFTPGVPYNYIGIRSRLGENVGDDPWLAQFVIS